VAAGPLGPGWGGVPRPGGLIAPGRGKTVEDLAPEPASEYAAAEGLAELFVAAWLAGKDTSSMLGDESVHVGEAAELAAGSWRATRTVSLGVDESSAGSAAAVVAADVERRVRRGGGPQWVPAGRRLFTVGLVDTGSGWAVTGPPALVAAPASGDVPDRVLSRWDGLGDRPGLEEAVTLFFEALLSGDGDLVRYTSPGSGITPVIPPPFASVEVVTSGSVPWGESLLVGAVVSGSDRAVRSPLLEYWLVVAEREGRWEVAALLPAAPLLDEEVDR
jgi:Conjugative transposon protein TcpC